MTSNLTPRFETVKVKYISIDIGLQPNPKENWMALRLYFKREKQFPPTLQLWLLDAVHQKCKELWEGHCCKKCGGKCCKDYCQTGWDRYKEWQSNGKKIDGGNFPLF